MRTIGSSIAVFACLVLAAVSLQACEQAAASKRADQKQSEATASSMSEAHRQVGMPSITNFTERKLMKQILELRDREDLVCYAYIVNLHGDLVFVGRCVGFGLPYSVQFTNPERVAHETKYNGGSFGTLPQPDPNGLFMPGGLSATWLMLLDEHGDARPVYIEPEIIVSPFPLM